MREENDDRLRRLADAAEALAGELSLDAVLNAIAETAAHVTGARYSALGVLDEEGTSLARFITYGLDDERIRRIGHLPKGKGVLGLLIREPRIIRLDDIRSHPASYGFPSEHPEMRSFLGAPVLSRGTVYGNLYLTEKDGGFTDEDERLIAVLAAQAGAAVENALLSQRLQALAVQEERDRISRELHDGVIQSLFSIGMGLESARNLVSTDPERVVERIDAAVDAIDGAIRELRNYIFRLRAHDAASLGLERGLAELAREYEVNALIRPSLVLDDALDAQVPSRYVPDLLQVAREALSNCAKHARASHVVISATFVDSTVELTITDDGVGFIDDGAQIGRGLENMAERAVTMGGTLHVDSEPDRGTRVRVTVPIGQEEP